MSRYITFLGVLLVYLGPASRATENPPVMSNVDFLTAIVNRDVRGEVEWLVKNQGERLQLDTVYLRSMKIHPGDWLVEQAILEVLRSRKIVVRAKAKPPSAGPSPSRPATEPADTTGADTTAQADSADTVTQTAPVPPPKVRSTHKNFGLSYRVVDCFIVYEKISRTGIFGRRQIKRYGKVSGNMRLIDQRSNTIVWSRDFSHAQTDIIPYSKKHEVENSNYNYVRTGQVKPYWQELLEITLAGGSVGYLLYLFFSQSFN